MSVAGALPRLRGEVRSPGFLLLLAAVAFQAVLLAPELRIERVPVNDAVFHLAASERLGQSILHREPFLDPWVSEWSLGYPVWRTYQPLPHLLAAGVLAIGRPFGSPAALFAALQYALLVLLPISAYAAARGLGLGRTGAGLASLLILAPSGAGEFGRYGLEYGAFIWRGSGLYTQLVALHFFLLALAATSRALDSGRGRAGAGALLAATALSHIVFGYAVAASAVLLALTGPAGQRRRRIGRLFAIAAFAAALTAWFVAPIFLARGEINHSRWESAEKWNSFGAPSILHELGSGRLFDSGRLPALTLFLLAGAILAAARLRDPLARRLLALTVAWLALFFGRATWGKAIALAGVPADMPMHRFQGAFECFAVLLAAWGLETALRLCAGRRALRALLIAAIAAGAAAIGIERARYLADNARWGDRNLQAFNREAGDLRAAMAMARRIVSERPGRVSGGKAAEWGSTFKVGDTPMFAFLTLEHFDQVSFLYHAMSKTSDIMVLRDESNDVHDFVFGIRCVVAPATWQAPAFLHSRGVYGRFAVYEGSPSGYFGLVDVAARSSVARDGEYDVDSFWLGTPWTAVGLVAAFDRLEPGFPEFAVGAPTPAVPYRLLSARGEVVSETAAPGTFRARIHALRACDAFVKVTWDPRLSATVDGKPALLRRVTPGFGAVAVPPGLHDVVVRYRPGPLRPILFFAGLLGFLAAARREKRAGRSGEQTGETDSKPADLVSSPSAKRVEVAAAAVLVLAVAAVLWMGRTGSRASASGGASGTGVQPSMAEGLRALYELHDPEAAVRSFEAVLRAEPAHYGATFQMARALDAAGRPEQARPYWVRMFSMAEAAHDRDTLQIVRDRLARPDVSGPDALMKTGIDALYTRHDAEAAARAFREVLRLNPQHYGATYQLAAALDKLGRPGEALPFWRTVLEMAERFGDAATASTAQARIAASKR